MLGMMLRVVWMLVLVGGAAVGQVELPHATGTLTVPEGWTVLGAEELAKETRETDPKGGIASMQLTGLVDSLKADNRQDEHVILHRFGEQPDMLQMINCYSADDMAISEELVADDNAKKMSEALAKAIGGGDIDIACTGYEVSEMFAIKSLLMHFALAGNDSQWRMDVYAVPSGERLQYFEAQYLENDSTALAGIETIIASYTGASEGESRISNLMIGGLAGAVAGILTAVMRRRRQMRVQGNLTATGSEAAAS